MTVDHNSSPPSEPHRRAPLLIWVALGIAAVLALASLMAISHRSGVPTLSPGVKGAPHASSTSIYEAARKSGPS